MLRTIEVSTPSRLHFGMFSFGRVDARQFGGVGVMIDRPGVRLRITPAAKLAVSGPLAQRSAAIIDRLTASWRLQSPPDCEIEILNSPPEHAGLGSGTQLELAVTAGLNAFRGGDPLSAAQLAKLSGRGARSAIGTYGFLYGGLLVESGKLPGEALSPLEQRLDLPSEWRFLLVMRPGEGLAGDAERRAFGSLPPVPPEVTVNLRTEVEKHMIPAALDGLFNRFSESLYRFNRDAGMCFAASQGGAYANSSIADVVERFRSEGVRGVGQSSWGPTVFALLESEQAAQALQGQFSSTITGESCLIARPASTGATVNITET